MENSFEKYLDLFIKHIKFEKGFSNHTVKSYENDLIDFFEFLKGEKLTSFNELTYEKIYDFITSLGRKGLKSSTLERKIASLKTFFKFLKREKVVEKNPMVLVTSPKKAKRLPVFMEKGEIFDLINLIPENDAFSIRNKTMILLLYATGMRISELCNLNLSSIDLKNELVYIYGKGKKYRVVPIGKKAKEMLQKYLIYRKEFHAQNDALFVTKSGKRIMDRAIRYILDKYINALAIQKNVSPHTLRHTFATHLLDNGANIRVIQEMLGHSNLATTQIYTHLSIKKLKENYEKFHPHA